MAKDVDIENVELLMAHAAKDKSSKGLRTFALLTVLQSTGARISEVLSIARKDVVRNGGIKDWVVITGKGGKRRKIFLNENARDAIFDYISTHGSAWVFKGLKGQALSRNCANVHLKAAALEIGLEGFHPHLMRHYFVKKLDSLGKDYRDVQKLLGHSNQYTTAHYGGGVINKRIKIRHSNEYLSTFSRSLERLY